MKRRWDEDLVKRGQSKTNRFAVLKSFGLNCPEYHRVTIDNYGELAHKFKDGASIRCYGDGDIPNKWTFTYMECNMDSTLKMPPHYPFVEGIAEHILYELMEKGWNPVITDGIKMSDNLFSGCIVSIRQPDSHFNEFLLEAAVSTSERAVGVRDISHGGKVDIALKLPNGIRGVGSGAFVEIYNQIKPLRSVNCYLEFGYLKKPAGRLNTRAIFWDIYFVGG